MIAPDLLTTRKQAQQGHKVTARVRGHRATLGERGGSPCCCNGPHTLGGLEPASIPAQFWKSGSKITLTASTNIRVLVGLRPSGSFHEHQGVGRDGSFWTLPRMSGCWRGWVLPEASTNVRVLAGLGPSRSFHKCQGVGGAGFFRKLQGRICFLPFPNSRGLHCWAQGPPPSEPAARVSNLCCHNQHLLLAEREVGSVLRSLVMTSGALGSSPISGS